MSMDTLQHHHDRLRLQLDTASADVQALLDTLHDDVLPQLQFELALTDPDLAWLSEWLSDTASIFRLLRRHKFVRPFALQEIRSIAIWRIHVLRPVLLVPVPTLFRCLAPPITDPFGRPIAFLRLASLSSFPCSLKDAFLQEVERLRLHLRYIRDRCAHTGAFPLQYLLLLDLDGVSLRNYNLDLCSWILTDIVPRYPGMFAAVFLLNYSWAHSGAWSLAKQILPSKVIARIFFPSKAQLVSYCSAANLPAEYGGSLPTLDHIDDALRSPFHIHPLPPPPPPPPLLTHPTRVDNRPPPSLSPASSNPAPRRVPSMIVLPALSLGNPFFGYPAIASAARPHVIQHVRRGPRELVRTLAVLWWRRWHQWVWACAYVVACLLVLRTRRARRTIAEGLETMGMGIGARVAALGLVKKLRQRSTIPRAQT